MQQSQVPGRCTRRGRPSPSPTPSSWCSAVTLDRPAPPPGGTPGQTPRHVLGARRTSRSGAGRTAMPPTGLPRRTADIAGRSRPAAVTIRSRSSGKRPPCRIGARGAEGRIKIKGRSDWPVLRSAKCPSYLPAAGPCALTRDLARTGRCRCPILGASSAPARRTAAVLQSAWRAQHCYWCHPDERPWGSRPRKWCMG